MQEGFHLLSLGSIDLNSATVQGTYIVPARMQVRRFALRITNAVGATGALSLTYRPTPGSGTGEVTISTINLTTAHVLNAIVYPAADADVVVPAGAQLTVTVSDVAAASDTADAFVMGTWIYEAPTNEDTAKVFVSA